MQEANIFRYSLGNAATETREAMLMSYIIMTRMWSDWDVRVRRHSISNMGDYSTTNGAMHPFDSSEGSK